MIEPKKKADPYAVEQTTAAAAAKAGGPAGGAPDAAGFSERTQDGVLVITFEQSNVLDAYEIEKLGDAIYRRIKPIETPRVVVDLGNVKHLSSAALGMLIAVRQVVVEKKHGGMAIANVNKDLRSIFKVTRLDKLTPMCDSTDKAVRKLA